MKLKKFGFLILPSVLLLMSSCLNGDDNEEDYREWMQQNLEYIEKAKTETVDGKAKYEQYTPVWDKSTTILMAWHNDRTKTQNNISPLDNSTCDVKYLLTNITGDTIDSSYAMTINGDSIYRCQPNGMVTGFRAALCNMNVGDSVTTVIPFTAGYGVFGNGTILPYSTLIFQIKLVGIPAFETLPERQ